MGLLFTSLWHCVSLLKKCSSSWLGSVVLQGATKVTWVNCLYSLSCLLNREVRTDLLRLWARLTALCNWLTKGWNKHSGAADHLERPFFSTWHTGRHISMDDKFSSNRNVHASPLWAFSLFWAVFSGVLVSVLLCLYTFSFHNLPLVLIFVLKTFGCSFCLLNLVSVL